MKTVFTICLWPMAIIGAGMITAIAWNLAKAGWTLGNRFFRETKKRLNL